MPSDAAKKARTCEMKWRLLSVRQSQSVVSVLRSIYLAVQNEASACLYICQISSCWMGKRTKRWRFARRSGSGARSPLVSAVLCFDGGLRGEVGVVGFCIARVVLTQNSSQSSPLSRMKWKAWYVTACCRGMVLGWGGFWRWWERFVVHQSPGVRGVVVGGWIWVVWVWFWGVWLFSRVWTTRLATRSSGGDDVVEWAATLEDVPSDFWAELTIMREVMDWDFHFPRNVV